MRIFRKVYQDAELIVLDKPSGMLAVPGRGPDLQDCLSARVQTELPAAAVVHRLDRDTSGLIVMALTADAQRELSRQFAAREVEKVYRAMVFDSPADDEGLIDLPLRKDFDRPPRHMVCHVHGRAAQTSWRVVRRFADRTLLEVKPITGRSHQIRIHLAELKHPILGDPLYAHEAALGMAERLMLHAEQLTVTHPRTGERMAWHVECEF